MLNLQDQINSFQQDLQYRIDNGIHSRGIPTGFTELDDIISGVQAPDIVVVAARPGMGKTAFSSSLIRNYLNRDLSVSLFSIEMDHKQLLARLIAQKTGVPLKALNEARVTPFDKKKIDEGIEWLRTRKLMLDDKSSPSLDYIEGRIRAADKQDLVVVDYLGIIDLGDDGTGSREQIVSGATRRIKAMARTYEFPLILLSQLNRQCEARKDKRPLLSDLRDSGQVEADADMVWFLYRDQVYNPDADPFNIEVLVRKNRHGETGTAHLKWLGESTAVESYEPTTSETSPPAELRTAFL